VDQSAYLWTKTALATYILRTLGDGTEMAHSVEGRVPFLDHPLAEFARTLPVSLKIRGGVEKWVLREAVRPWVSPAMLHRSKHPFMGPVLAAHPAMRALVASLLDEPQPFFDRARVLALYDRIPHLAGAERTACDAAAMLVATALLVGRAFRLGA
jgi:asparagine synthase (glutamine-hydrolysing)